MTGIRLGWFSMGVKSNDANLAIMLDRDFFDHLVISDRFLYLTDFGFFEGGNLALTVMEAGEN